MGNDDKFHGTPAPRQYLRPDTRLRTATSRPNGTNYISVIHTISRTSRVDVTTGVRQAKVERYTV